MDFKNLIQHYDIFKRHIWGIKHKKEMGKTVPAKQKESVSGNHIRENGIQGKGYLNEPKNDFSKDILFK